MPAPTTWLSAGCERLLVLGLLLVALAAAAFWLAVLVRYVPLGGVLARPRLGDGYYIVVTVVAARRAASVLFLTGTPLLLLGGMVHLLKHRN
ncbi:MULTISPECIES: hypothetical protein [unclassified Xanthomonas]|uniref:hypothetical protein n=1 Tax=unclassified Xanthomonas TaxID=2643310 RepID=UPI00136B0E68|nr:MULTISPECIES: hypothetical protein [unclassified Xanthomonas]MBB6366208.1 hypothetical protein [Xanthomonas sp. F10]MXV32709.1 hypothetical protein [Xanthomonas sp. LMG 8989]UYC10454.1 hypothetical protein NUG21_11660 [Xanthomonas sp. CFBP 8445]